MTYPPTSLPQLPAHPHARYPTALCPLVLESSLLPSLRPSSQSLLLDFHGLPCLWSWACNTPQLQTEKQSRYPKLARLSGAASKSTWDVPSRDHLSACETCCHSADEHTISRPDVVQLGFSLVWAVVQALFLCLFIKCFLILLCDFYISVSILTLNLLLTVLHVHWRLKQTLTTPFSYLSEDVHAAAFLSVSLMLVYN